MQTLILYQRMNKHKNYKFINTKNKLNIIYKERLLQDHIRSTYNIDTWEYTPYKETELKVIY